MSHSFPALAATLLCLAAGAAAAEPAGTVRTAECGRQSLRVMTFNIEWGGAHVRFASVPEAIAAAGADVAGVQEAEGNLERLARELGWHYSRRNHVVSKYPLIDPPGGDGRFLFVETRPGCIVALANVHLPSDPYGPHLLREGRDPSEVMAVERELRLAAITPVLDLLAPIHRRGVPVFLTGDFNAPSHEDWTDAAAGRFPHRDAAFAWPVSRAVEGAGFHDSYRAVHPDPVERPGFTWWAARPLIAGYNPSDPGDRDRIDFVWFAGPAKVRDSRLVGEADAAEVPVGVSPWPSDHRAVVSEFTVEPAPMPVLVSTEQRVYRIGEAVEVFWRAPEANDSIVLLQDGGDAPAELRVAADSMTGRVNVPTAGLPPGPYRVALLDSGGRARISNDLWLLERGAKPSIAVGAETLAVGDPVPIEWSNAAGNRFDWIAIYDARATDSSRSYITYGYVGARSSGTLELGARTAREGWPLPPGRYVARLLEDDGFELLAESEPFAVERRAEPGSRTK